MYIPISLFGTTVAHTVFFAICVLLATILASFICGLLVFALVMWLARRGTIYEAGDVIVRLIRGRQR